MESEVLYEKIIFENVEKAFQLRLVLNEFRDKQYLHIRKYFLSFDDGYIPTKEGASMEASIHNIYALLDGLLELVASSEGIDGIEKHFSGKILDLKNKIQ
jgi:Transcriptional Coactivator p15 (PC4)